MAFNPSAQSFGQQWLGQYGPQNELGAIIGAVVQATVPAILGSMRGQQPGYLGGQFGAPGFHFQQGYGGQGELSNLVGPVLQAALPVILSSLRSQGQPQWQGGQGYGQYGQWGMAAFQPQQQGFPAGQSDLGNVIGPVLQAALPVILGSLQASQGQGGWRM